MSFIYTLSQSPIFINTTGVSNRRNQKEFCEGFFLLLNKFKIKSWKLIAIRFRYSAPTVHSKLGNYSFTQCEAVVISKFMHPPLPPPSHTPHMDHYFNEKTVSKEKSIYYVL